MKQVNRYAFRCWAVLSRGEIPDRRRPKADVRAFSYDAGDVSLLAG